jgi:hydrogenase nickel incorporation protein HypA/HybF
VENKLRRIRTVTVQLGEVSTVLPYYFEDCWQWAVKKETGALKDAALVLERINAITYCEDCGQTYPTVQHGKRCPHCGSEHTYLLQGNELFIKEIEAVEDACDEAAEIEK